MIWIIYTDNRIMSNTHITIIKLPDEKKVVVLTICVYWNVSSISVFSTLLSLSFKITQVVNVKITKNHIDRIVSKNMLYFVYILLHVRTVFSIKQKKCSLFKWFRVRNFSAFAERKYSSQKRLKELNPCFFYIIVITICPKCNRTNINVIYFLLPQISPNSAGIDTFSTSTLQVWIVEL